MSQIIYDEVTELAYRNLLDRTLVSLARLSVFHYLTAHPHGKYLVSLLHIHVFLLFKIMLSNIKDIKFTKKMIKTSLKTIFCLIYINNYKRFSGKFCHQVFLK